MISVETKITQVLSVFEMGRKDFVYDAVYTYSDGIGGRKQVTLSFGLTEDSGGLYKFLLTYSTLNGLYGSKFAPYMSKIGTGTLHSSEQFKSLLKEASQKDEFFNEVQDFCFHALYLRKGYQQAKNYGIVTNLGVMVICDSILHGGLNTVTQIVENKAILRPSKGGNEKEFITEYIDSRIEWLTNKGGLLANTIYRSLSFKDAIQNDNWNLDKPFDANGTII